MERPVLHSLDLPRRELPARNSHPARRRPLPGLVA